MATSTGSAAIDSVTDARDGERGERAGARGATAVRFYTALVAGSLALAALTLIYPSTPTYDPWSWIIWGREIAHFTLETTGGPSWKPLPVAFTTVFSVFGGAAPLLWVVIGRAGAIAGIFMVARLAYRITSEYRPFGARAVSVGGVDAVAVFAAFLGAATLLLSRGYFRNEWLANSEGLLVAFGLMAFDRHMDRRFRQALVMAFLAALIRPEVWPFLGLYGLWLLIRRPNARVLVIALGVAVPVLWFLPEYIGSGDWLRASSIATQLHGNHSPVTTPHPFFTILRIERTAFFSTVKVGAAIAVAVALIALIARRREQMTIWLAAVGAGWVILIGLMTQAGYSGNPRYLVLATSIVCVLSGIGWARVLQGAQVLATREESRPRVVMATVAVIAAAILVASWTGGFKRLWGEAKGTASALEYQAWMRTDLATAVDRAGGAKRLLACGPVATGRYQVPMVAWALDVRPSEVGSEVAPPRGVILQTRSTRGSELIPPAPATGFPYAVYNGTWRVYSSCPVPAGGS